MRPFQLLQAESAQDAVSKVSKHENARFLGGGTNLIDLMKEDVERPDFLVDVERLALSSIEELQKDVGLSSLFIAERRLCHGRQTSFASSF